MKRKLIPGLFFGRKLRLFGLLGALFLGFENLPGAEDFPAWWQTRGLMAGEDPLDDFAELNQGQLRRIVVAAYDEMDARLAAPVGGGSGAESQVTALIKAWFEIDGAGNFVRDADGHRVRRAISIAEDSDVVTLGQIKAVAQPFYARLIQIGYYSNYPWDVSATPPEEDDVVSLGQAKDLFNFKFDVSPLDAVDSDHDGLPDWWEGQHGLDTRAATGDNGANGDPDADGLTNAQEYARGTDPSVADAELPYVQVMSGVGQWGSPGTFLPVPLVLRAVAASGAPLAGREVTITTNNTAGVSSSATGPSRTVYHGETATDGTISVYCYLGSDDQGSVNYQVGLQGSTFRRITQFLGSTPRDPSDVAVFLDENQYVQVSWKDNSTDEGAFQVQRSPDRVEWEVLATLPPDTTAYADFLPTVNRYYYKVVSTY